MRKFTWILLIVAISAVGCQSGASSRMELTRPTININIQISQE